MGLRHEVPDRRSLIAQRACPAGKYLIERGWRPADDGWRHAKLEFAWPFGAAVQLQEEADDGRMDVAHRALRGEG